MKWYIYHFTLNGEFTLTFIEPDDESALEKFLMVCRDMGALKFSPGGLAALGYADIRVSRNELVPLATDDTEATDVQTRNTPGKE